MLCSLDFAILIQTSHLGKWNLKRRIASIALACGHVCGASRLMIDTGGPRLLWVVSSWHGRPRVYKEGSWVSPMSKLIGRKPPWPQIQVLSLGFCLNSSLGSHRWWAAACLLRFLQEQIWEVFRVAVNQMLLHLYLPLSTSPQTPNSSSPRPLPTSSHANGKQPDLNRCP